ncbi:MAG: DUF1573 domain-containing protein [Bacteroidales bacterium]|nr:DUF1573 domain-containing protein [Bacteroidales bacterium]
MKKHLILVSIGILNLFVACTSNTDEQVEPLISTEIVNNPNTADPNSKKENNLPVFKFDHTDFDFGLIFEGEKVMHKFKFSNVGKTDLVISDVTASCGCTVPKYSRKPVKPGDEGFIEVEFDSSGRKGQQHKTVTIVANTQPNRVQLMFTAEIEVQK